MGAFAIPFEEEVENDPLLMIGKSDTSMIFAKQKPIYYQSNASAYFLIRIRDDVVPGKQL